MRGVEYKFRRFQPLFKGEFVKIKGVGGLIKENIA